MTTTPDTVPHDLADALTRRGYPGAEVVRAVRGPLASRYRLVLRDGRHLWVDLTPDGVPPLGVPVAFSGPLAGREGVALADATSAGDALVHETPWPAVLLSERLTTGTTIAAAELALAAGLGQLLRVLHHEREPGVSCGPSPRRPRALDRVLASSVTGLASADRHIAAALDRILAAWPAAPVVLHGEPAAGHVLVPEAGWRGSSGPTALLSGWSGGPAGPAWFDVGYLIGDLVEIAHVVPAASRRGLLAMAGAVRTGYDPQARLSSEFWACTRDAAVLKLLDHEARITSAFGAQESARQLLRALAHTMLDPRSPAGSVFTAPLTPSEGSS